MTKSELHIMCLQEAQQIQVISAVPSQIRARGTFPDFVVEGTVDTSASTPSYYSQANLRVNNVNNIEDDAWDIILNGATVGRYHGRQDPAEDDTWLVNLLPGDNKLSFHRVEDHGHGNYFIITVTPLANPNVTLYNNAIGGGGDETFSSLIH